MRRFSAFRLSVSPCLWACAASSCNWTFTSERASISDVRFPISPISPRSVAEFFAGRGLGALCGAVVVVLVVLELALQQSHVPTQLEFAALEALPLLLQPPCLLLHGPDDVVVQLVIELLRPALALSQRVLEGFRALALVR